MGTVRDIRHEGAFDQNAAHFLDEATILENCGIHKYMRILDEVRRRQPRPAIEDLREIKCQNACDASNILGFHELMESRKIAFGNTIFLVPEAFNSICYYRCRK